jgi:hypothetical protein
MKEANLYSVRDNDCANIQSGRYQENYRDGSWKCDMITNKLEDMPQARLIILP